MTEMLRIYYQLRFRMAGRICRELGVVTILLLALLCLACYGLFFTEAKLRLMLFVGIALTMLQARGDRIFLESQFGKRYKRLLLSDTLLLAIPFVVLAIINHDWLYLPIIIGLSIVFSFVPKYSSGFSIPGCRLFSKGSYEFQKGMRTFLIPYCILLAVSVIGMIYDNIRIAEVATGFVCLIMVFCLFLPPDRSWMLNWCSASHFVKVKLMQTAVCSLVVLLPFLVLLLIGGLSWSIVVSVYFATVILLMEMEMLRFTIGDNLLLMTLAMVVLGFIAYFSVGIPYVFILSVMVLAWIVFSGYSCVSNVIEND